MAQSIHSESYAHRLGRSVRYTIFLLSAGLLVMTLSYHVTLWYAQQQPPLVRPAAMGMSEPELLYALSGEMTSLMREYLDRASLEAAIPSDAFQTWSRDRFAPRASELRRRIQATTATGDALSALLTAANRMVAMARQPDQLNLRQLATDNVFDAAAAVEDRLAISGLGS